MNVTIKRAGGVAGVGRILVSLDTRTVPASVAKKLERSVVDLVALARRHAPPASSTDESRYDIEFQHTPGITPLRVSVIDGAAPAVQTETLIEEILQLAPRALAPETADDRQARPAR